MTTRQKQAIFAVMVAKLIARATACGIKGFILEWYRTPERQAQLVKEKKSWTLKSKHITGLAIDFVIIDDNGKPVWDNKAYEPLGSFWVNSGGRWGGDWKQKDSVHFEYLDTAQV